MIHVKLHTHMAGVSIETSLYIFDVPHILTVNGRCILEGLSEVKNLERLEHSVCFLRADPMDSRL
mgnify:CR=1 FL=1